MHYTCPQHGKIRSIGKAPKHCPVCGGEAIPVWWIPRIYIDTDIIFTGFWLVVIASILFGGVFYIHGCVVESRLEDIESQKRINEMDPVWHSLYVSLTELWGDKQVAIVKSFVAANPPAVTPPLNPQDFNIIKNTLRGDAPSDVPVLLMPYMQKSTTRPNK